MGNIAAIYFFFVATIILFWVVVLVNKGTVGLRNFIIKCTEYALYLFMIAAMIVGGFVASPFGWFFGEGGLFFVMLLGAAAGFFLSIPIVTMVVLQIDIANSSRKAAGKPELGQ